MDWAAIERVVKDHKEANARSHRPAGTILCIPHICALDMEGYFPSPWLPCPEENLIFNASSVCRDKRDGEEIAVAGPQALASRQVFNDARKLFGELPAPFIEDAGISGIVEKQERVVGASTLGEAASEAMMTKCDVDTEFFG